MPTPPLPASVPGPEGAYGYMDASRALLALVVAFGHVWVLFVEDYAGGGSFVAQALYGLAGFAHEGVVMFFVLSGYWITRSVVGRAARGWSWRGYLVDRWSRLAIVLVPALLIGGALDAGALWGLGSTTHSGETGSWVLRKDVAQDLSPLVLLGNLLFLQGIATGTFGANGPLWSLAVEFWFYLWWPALWLLVRHRRPSWALLSFGLAALSPTLLLFFAQWLCGSLLFFAEARLSGRRASPLVLAGAGSALAAVALAARFAGSVAGDLLLAATWAGFLLALIAARPRLAAAARPLARFGARSSFSMYAMHFPLTVFAAALILGSRRLPPTAGTIALTGGVLAMATLGGWLFSRFTEARTAALRERLHAALRVCDGAGRAVSPGA